MTVRHFLQMTDLTVRELERLLRRAAQLKRARSVRVKPLAGKTVALVFQKPSMRTRVAFEVAVHQLGGTAIYLDQNDIKLGEREPIKDVARTLSRYVDAIVVRVFAHADAEEFTRYAGVPVINGLSHLHHPCQALADLLTIREHFGKLKGITVAYVGDGNNVLHSLAQGLGRIHNIMLRVATPTGYGPDKRIWSEEVRRCGGRLDLFVDDPKPAVRGADVIYTDVWTSMGQEREQEIRRNAFQAFQVNQALLALAKPNCVVMHCLPAHRGEEITEDVMESPRSLIFEQAENRLHVQKALLLMLLGRKS